MAKRAVDSAHTWTHVVAALASGLSIWAIVLALVPRFTDPAMSSTTSVSLASSVILLGAAVYGVGTWRKQERHRARHDIALRAIEATLEALERLDYARSVVTDQREAFRGAMARDEPWEPEDRLRLIQDVREVDVALKHLRTLSHLVRLHLGEKASTAMEELVGLTREFTRTSNLHFNGVERQLSGDEFKRTYSILYGYDENNPFTKKLLASREGLFRALEPYLLS